MNRLKKEEFQSNDSPQLKELIGNTIRDSSRTYFGYRSSKLTIQSGAISLVVCPSFLGVEYITSTLHYFPISINIFVFFYFIYGGLSFASGFLYEKSFDSDKKLLLDIESIGGYALPFGKKWNEQYEAGKNNPTYKLAHYLGGIAVSSIIVGVPFAIYAIIKMNI